MLERCQSFAPARSAPRPDADARAPATRRRCRRRNRDSARPCRRGATSLAPVEDEARAYVEKCRTAHVPGLEPCAWPWRARAPTVKAVPPRGGNGRISGFLAVVSTVGRRRVATAQGEQSAGGPSWGKPKGFRFGDSCHGSTDTVVWLQQTRFRAADSITNVYVVSHPGWCRADNGFRFRTLHRSVR